MQISGWLYQTACNRIIDFRRKQDKGTLLRNGPGNESDTFIREVTEVLTGDDEQSPGKEYLKALVWEELEKALGELPDEQRTVSEQTELNGLSYKELSAMNGIPVETLLSRKHYAVKHLRKCLKEIYEDLLCDE